MVKILVGSIKPRNLTTSMLGVVQESFIYGNLLLRALWVYLESMGMGDELPACLPWIPKSEVTLDGGCEATRTQEFVLRDRVGPKISFDKSC